ncbi:MAG: hemolysin III family protein [Anaerolineae bacterium]|nr:hemolysin III family protein [Anaerolineae bacterium]
MMVRFREPVNGFTHLAGAFLAAVGLVLLVGLTRSDAARMISVVIYGISMIVLYSASAVYHLANGSEHMILWLRRIDHAAIYILIAGTYTPFCYNVLDGHFRWLMLGLVWGLAIVGVLYKLLFLNDGGYLSLIFYVAMGWVGIIALPEALRLLPPSVIVLILSGGALYMIGAVIFGIEKPNLHPYFGHHEIWHLLVLGGSAFHFVAVLRCVV